jgi:glycosyltransferase involved in cell wall biosynthesis
MQKISAVIITLNEERNIGCCLESIRWVDEIIIVDAFSKDNTLMISARHTDKIFQREWPGYSEQKNFGLSRANGDWVLFIDADEEVSPPLVSEIRQILSLANNSFAGYRIQRESFYLGKWIKHGEWSPDRQLRLIRKGNGLWVGPSVHEQILLDGRVGYLKNKIYHYTYRDIAHHLEKLNRYSSLFAHDALVKKQRSNLCQLFIKPFSRFIKAYFLKQGFRDGLAGLVIAVMQSFEVFLRYAKLKELKRGC